MEIKICLLAIVLLIDPSMPCALRVNPRMSGKSEWQFEALSQFVVYATVRLVGNSSTIMNNREHCEKMVS